MLFFKVSEWLGYYYRSIAEMLSVRSCLLAFFLMGGCSVCDNKTTHVLGDHALTSIKVAYSVRDILAAQNLLNITISPGSIGKYC